MSEKVNSKTLHRLKSALSRSPLICIFLSIAVLSNGAFSFNFQPSFSTNKIRFTSKIINQIPLQGSIRLTQKRSETFRLKLSKSNDDKSIKKRSKRAKFLNLIGIKHLPAQKEERKVKEVEDGTVKSSDSPSVEKVEITTVEALDNYFEDREFKFRKNNNEMNGDSPIDYKALLTSLSVKGDTQIIGSKDHPNVVHPVLQLLHERRQKNSKPVEGLRSDGCKIALAVEGGGMRGCVSAGMVVAVDYLGLRECIDVVYGSSAGSLIGSYFLTKQLPWFGPEIYYDSLTTAGKKFIDTKRLLRAVGLGLADPRLLKDVITRRNSGKPVLELDFLLKYTAMNKKPLDWEKFKDLQKVQPLKVIASGLKSEKSIILDMEKGSFNSLEQLTNCMHASMLLPGIAGPVMNMCKNPDGTIEFVRNNNHDWEDEECEPMVDALIYEPLPYRSAITEGATHVVVLRTRPDGVDVTGKPSVFERLIMKRFFLKKNKLPPIFDRMNKQLHKKLYGEDIIVLNEAAQDLERDCKDISSPHIMTIALPPGSDEVTRLETGRKEIFEGVRRGFARAYDALVDDPNERGRGAIVAKEVFPDQILDYDPLEIDGKHESAFSTYLRQEGTSVAMKIN